MDMPRIGFAKMTQMKKRGLSQEQQQYVRQVVQQLLDSGMSQWDVARRLGCNQSRVSKAKLTGEVSLEILIAAAKLAGRPADEIAKITKVPMPSAERTAAASVRALDPPIGTFLLRLAELPGLKRWLLEHPGAVRVSEVCRGIDVYDRAQIGREPDGSPLGGWGAFFADLRSGHLNPDGRAQRVVQAEIGQHPKLR